MKVFRRALIKAAAMRLDRLSHRFGMGGEKEAGHVDAITPQVELSANGVPVIEYERGRGQIAKPLFRKAGGECTCTYHQPGADQKIPAAEAKPSECYPPILHM
jgi:hypothetical protein